MKKTYIEPMVKVIKMRSQKLLSGSDFTINRNIEVEDYDVLE